MDAPPVVSEQVAPRAFAIVMPLAWIGMPEQMPVHTGRLAGRTGCAPRRYAPNRTEVILNVPYRDRFGHRPYHHLRSDRAPVVTHRLAAAARRRTRSRR